MPKNKNATTHAFVRPHIDRIYILYVTRIRVCMRETGVGGRSVFTTNIFLKKIFSKKFKTIFF